MGIITKPGKNGAGTMTEDEMISEYKKGLCEHGNYHCSICEAKFKQLLSKCPICWEMISGKMEDHIRVSHPDGANA
jgi:hypothetical protein